jgi:hypothetical protein
LQSPEIELRELPLTDDDEMPSNLDEGMAAKEDQYVEREMQHKEEVRAEWILLELLLCCFLE